MKDYIVYCNYCHDLQPHTRRTDSQNYRVYECQACDCINSVPKTSATPVLWRDTEMEPKLWQ